MLADRGSEPGFGVLTGSMSGLPSSRCQNCSAAFTNLSEKICPSCGRVRAELTTTGFVESSYRVRTRQGQEIGQLPLATVAQMLRDGVIDSDDAVYASLRLWYDSNHDGIGTPNEMIKLKEAKVQAIDLKYDSSFREKDRYGNETVYKSVIQYEDGSLDLVFDLWFNYKKP